MNKEAGKVIIAALLGFISSYFVMFVLKNTNLSQFERSLYLDYIFTGLFVILTILTLSYVVRYLQIRQLTRRSVSSDEEDAIDDQVNRYYADGMMIVQFSNLLSIGLASFSIIENQFGLHLILSGFFFVISCIASIYFLNLMRQIYPNRYFPKYSEKNYAEKLFAASDDGERHVMFEGLIRSQSLLQFLLMGIIIVLVVYSYETGQSQIFAISLLIIALIWSNAKYFLHVRNR
ncbi:hypothetical protein AYO36_05890 [Exiguobacterium sp. KKBO11]|uniref:DUF3169 family protein n=1 Tax=Exiguobacterium sp. KKBO11 TaxID=1805000 RepID=UPI0007D7A746|nr:DUF3169 family protein [Exiguobacterium sp. KKBO11]OAI89679.1 hypothetical protein AYO36_05890 [Exiguobacterium sp. KKBO11]